MPSLHSSIRRQRFGAKFFWAKSLKISAIDSVTKCMIQAKLKQDNDNSIRNYTLLIKKLIHTSIGVNKISNHIVVTSTVYHKTMGKVRTTTILSVHFIHSWIGNTNTECKCTFQEWTVHRCQRMELCGKMLTIRLGSSLFASWMQAAACNLHTVDKLISL